MTSLSEAEQNSNRALAGLKILFISTSGSLNDYVYAIANSNGWGDDSFVLEKAEDIEANLVDRRYLSVMAVILEQDSVKCDSFINLLFDHHVESSQVILGVPHDSLRHRVLLKSGITPFPYTMKTTANGLEINFEALPSVLKKAYLRHCSLQLEEQITRNINSGILALLPHSSTVTSAAIKERAHIAAAMANFIHVDLESRLSIIQLSLFCDIIFYQDFERIIRETKSIWLIKEALEIRAQYLSQNDVGTANEILVPVQLKRDTPFELIVVETAIFIQSYFNSKDEKVTKNDANFSIRLKKFLESLSFECQTSICLAYEECFKNIWSRLDEYKQAG